MKTVLPWWLALGLFGCGVEEGASLEILGETVPSSECAATNKVDVMRSHGFWDPRGSFDVPVGTAYAMPLVLRNNLRLAAADPAGSFSGDNRRVDANALQIIGFDACWVRADGEGGPAEASQYGSWSDGVPDKLTCSNLPSAQRAWIASSTMLEPDGGLAGIYLSVLDEAALQSLYGSAFAPRAIPSIGRFDPFTGAVSATGTAYSNQPVSPVSEPRDAAWGSYPHGKSAIVLLQVRATAKDQAGNTVQSNWFVHPLELCTGCLADACGTLTVETPATGPCLKGSVVSSTCLPAQGYTVTCSGDYSTCPATP